MQSFVKNVLLINGLINIGVGLCLIFLPIQMANWLGYPQLPDYMPFVIGGWGIASLTLGLGRTSASRDKRKYRLWAFLGLLEGFVLSLFCLRYWLGGALTFRQVSVPFLIAVFFGAAYAVSIPTWSRVRS